MSVPETPVQTDVERLLAASEAQREAIANLTQAVNGLGMNVQWIIDQAKGIFEMFSNPAFASMLPQMMGGTPDGEGN